MTEMPANKLNDLSGGSLDCGLYIFGSAAASFVGGAALGPVAGFLAFGFLMARSPC